MEFLCLNSSIYKFYAVILQPNAYGAFHNDLETIFADSSRFCVHDQHVNTNTTYLFFDGICGLCNGVVDFLLHFDKKQKIMFVTLQSDFAKKELPENLTTQLSTLVVKRGDQILTRSEAVFLLIRELGGGFRILLLFQIFPIFILNIVYDYIAASRYSVFGKKDTCRIPTPQERSRFIV